MSGLDNGPADGDFVRYIDALLATRAAAIPATAQKLDASPLAPPQKRSPSTVTSFVTPAAPPRNVSPRPSTMLGATLTPAQAAAVAATMMRTGGTNVRSIIAIVAILIGLAMLIAGWVGTAFNAPLVFIGGALVYWAIKLLTDRTGTQQPPARKP